MSKIFNYSWSNHIPTSLLHCRVQSLRASFKRWHLHCLTYCHGLPSKPLPPCSQGIVQILLPTFSGFGWCPEMSWNIMKQFETNMRVSKHVKTQNSRVLPKRSYSENTTSAHQNSRQSHLYFLCPCDPLPSLAISLGYPPHEKCWAKKLCWSLNKCTHAHPHTHAHLHIFAPRVPDNRIDCSKRWQQHDSYYHDITVHNSQRVCFSELMWTCALDVLSQALAFGPQIALRSRIDQLLQKEKRWRHRRCACFGSSCPSYIKLQRVTKLQQDVVAPSCQICFILVLYTGNGSDLMSYDVRMFCNLCHWTVCAFMNLKKNKSLTMSGTSWTLPKLAYLSGWRLMTPTEISEPSRNDRNGSFGGVKLGLNPERVLKVYENAKVQRTCHELQWYIVIWTVFIASAASHYCLWHGSSLGTALGQSVFDDASNMSNAFRMVWFGNRMYCWRIDENRLAPTSSQTHGEKTVKTHWKDLKGHCWLFTPDLCHHAIDEQALQAKFHPHFAGGVANVLKDTGRITLQNVERNSKKNSSELWWKFYKGYSRNWFQSFRISGYRRIGVCYTGRFMSIGFKWCQFDSITLYIYIYLYFCHWVKGKWDGGSWIPMPCLELYVRVAACLNETRGAQKVRQSDDGPKCLHPEDMYDMYEDHNRSHKHSLTPSSHSAALVAGRTKP